MKDYMGRFCQRVLGLSVGLMVLRLGWTAVEASVPGGAGVSASGGRQGRKWVMPREAMPDRCRKIEIRTGVLGEAAFTLNLFAGESVRLERDRVVELPGGDRVWSGRIQGEPLSRATFAVRAGVVSGVVDRAMSTGNELYEIQPDGSGGYFLFQHAETRVAASGESLGEEDAGGARSAAPAAGVGVGVVRVIDVMMLYTPASRTRYGQAGIEAKILQAVADANTAMENSHIAVRFALVHLGEVSYVETGSMTAALMALQRTADGILDEVHALRDQHGADLTTLVDEDTSSCGLSYLMSTPSTGFAANAFSVVYSGCLASLTLVHEWGHNLGCQHDRANAAGPASYPFAYGWRQCSTNVVMFRTVMSYACGSAIRINYFSNPRLSYAGLPLGVDEATDPANASDNSRAIGLNAAYATDFRPSMAGSVPAAPAGLGVQSASHTEVVLAWVDMASTEVVQAVERSADGVEWSLLAVLEKDVTTYADRAVVAGEQWYYRLSAVNGVGESGPSAVAGVVVPEAPSVPLAPAEVTASCVDRCVQVAWVDRSDNEQGFRVERSVNSGTFLPLIVLDAGTTGYLDTAVSAGSTYSYRVFASNIAGDSSACDSGTVVMPEVAPSAPTDLKGFAVTRGQINLAWVDTSANETGFRIERSTNGSTWTPVGTVGANVQTYSATGLKSATTYYFRVQAFNAVGASAYTLKVAVKTLR